MTWADDGYRIIEGVLDEETCDRWIERLAPWCGDEARAGRRGVLDQVTPLLRTPALCGLVEDTLGADAFAVRALLFDKTPDANWSIRWHQDHTITVTERIEVNGFRGWSQKDTLHVQAPTGVVREMLTLRVHLDDVDERSGALRVIPGSWRRRVATRELRALAETQGEVTCSMRSGGVLLMRPTIAHTSTKTERAHRRVVHIEFADRPLPGGLEWAQRVGLN